MRDTQMFNILESLKNVGNKKQNLNESAGNHTVSSHVTNDSNTDAVVQGSNQDTMRNIMDSVNEALDKNQRRVNQMPGTHRMKKASRDGTHPAGKYLVGGEFDDETDLDEDRQYDPTDQYNNYRADPSDDNSTKQMKMDQLYNKLSDKNPDVPHEKLMQMVKNIVLKGLNEAGRLQGTDRENDDWEQSYDEEDPISPESNPGMYDFDDDDLNRKDYDDDPMNKRHYESKTNEASGRLQGTDRENDDWEPAGGDRDWENNLPDEDFDWGVEDDDIDADIPDLENDLNRQDYFDDPMNDRHYESVGESEEEFYDSETMSFRKRSVTEDDIEEDTIANKSTARKHGLHKEKGSLKDVFKSMSETDEDKEKTLEQELHTEINRNTMQRNERGSYNLAEEDIADIQHKIKSLKQLMASPGRSGNAERDEIQTQLRTLQKKLQATKKKKPGKNPNDPAFNRPPEHKLY